MPNPLIKEWNSVFNGLCDANSISISRWVSYDPTAYIEVHGFGDASSKAIAAAAYIRVIKAYQAKSSLLVAKTRLAPVKTVFIARLEFYAAVLFAKLTHHVIKTFSLEHC